MSLLRRTDQTWKLNLFVACLALGVGITLFQWMLTEPLGEELTVKIVVGVLFLVIMRVACACLFIVCPRCNLRLIPHALRTAGLGGWFNWVRDVEACPGCGSEDGFSPAPPVVSRRRKRRR